jgi:L-alanine-DL-glutamate epimerase-like enolase superfamily enzyme
VLVHVETDDGTGIGESPADIGFFGQTLEGIQVAIDDYLGPQLVGREPFDIQGPDGPHRLPRELLRQVGIAMALHDLVAKARGISVAELLGGRKRERIPVAIEIAGGSPRTWPTSAAST